MPMSLRLSTKPNSLKSTNAFKSFELA